MAGPQLVVPTDNPRYALNAANARWGSLYDAFYGSNVIPETAGRAISGSYNPVRGDAVIARSNAFLDSYFPLREGKYAEVVRYCLSGPEGDKALVMQLAQGGVTPLADPSQFTGFAQCEDELTNIWLAHNGLHVEIQIDPLHPVGRTSPSGVKDIILEAAVTTIQDFEDSVSAVDARDKARVYGNWNGIMKGVLETTFQKNGQLIERRLNPDKSFTTPRGKPATLPGRSLMLARNVGMHIYTHAVTTRDGHPIPEGFLDAMVSTLAALHDLKGLGRYRNSRSGSFYIVKPKLHGPEEVEFTARLFGRVEEAVGLPAHTLKMGIMDEERRTTVNLKACIREAKERIVFINTGFLDRTGDEIHTSMEAGPIIPKLEIKDAPWMLAYEDWNVDVGIETRLPGRGQIGKGMWTIPDDLKTMVETKGVHPEAGASTAWVPSPTAATLHAIHYHQVDVAQRHRSNWLPAREPTCRPCSPHPAPARPDPVPRGDIDRELENNAQGILGYVVRWIDQGGGVLKSAGFTTTWGLMEDRGHPAHFQPAPGQLVAPPSHPQRGNSLRFSKRWPQWSTDRMQPIPITATWPPDLTAASPFKPPSTLVFFRCPGTQTATPKPSCTKGAKGALARAN